MRKKKGKWKQNKEDKGNNTKKEKEKENGKWKNEENKESNTKEDNATQHQLQQKHWVFSHEFAKTTR